MSMNDKPRAGKSLALYAALQSASLGFCWIWFAALGIFGVSQYGLDQVQFWLLFGSACAGLYGLRPNLERAIDSMWLREKRTPAAASELIAQLKPVKRRIDVVFTIIIVAIMLILGAVYSLEFIGVVTGQRTQ